MNWFTHIIDFIVSFFTNMKYSLGPKMFEEGKPWKISCLTNTKFGLFIATYNSKTRQDSKIYLNGKMIYGGRGCKEETIGQGLVYGETVYFAGENGNLLIYNNGSITKGVRLAFASTCAMFNGKPYVFNTDNKGIHVINCLTGLEEFKMPGSGIVTMALEDGGKLYTAACDGAGGIACNDGTMLSLPTCQCIIKYNGRIFCSNGNTLLEKIDNNVKEITTMPCEKIMHMDVNNDLLWVAGANPDSLWIFNRILECKQIINFNDTITVGGSVFRTRVTLGYFGRAVGGTRVEVYPINK